MAEPNYYAVIPANVRYSANLSPNEKLLYGEISALANTTKQCWASNKYFANLYQVSPETVSRWISKLEKLEFISTTIDKSKGNRRYIKMAIDVFVNRYPQKDQVINNIINTVSKDTVRENEKNLLILLNRITGRGFRVLPRGASKTLKAFKLEEIEQALKNLEADEWHHDKLGELSSDYLIRASTIDKFLGIKNSAKKEIIF